VEVDLSSVFMDWTSVVLYGDCCKLGKRGYSKDKRPDKKQLKVGIAVANGSSVAFHYSVEEGNLVDLKQFQKDYAKIQNKIPEGSLIVFDKGANDSENLKKVCEKHEYLTAVKFSGSLREKIRSLDKKGMKQAIIYETKERVYAFREEINGVCRYYFYDERREEADKSQRKKEIDKVLEEKREQEKILKEKGLKAYKKKITRKNKQIKELGDVILKSEVTIQKRLLEKTEEDITSDLSQDKYLDGFYVLESNRKMNPKTALIIYRRKDQAEKLICDLKSALDVKPVRVWNTDRVKGALLIVLLAHLCIGLFQEAGCFTGRTKKTILEKLKNLTLVLQTGCKDSIIQKKYANLNQVTIRLLELCPG
jgi:transposase